MLKSAQLLAREFSEFTRLFAPDNASTRRLVFYAESSIYYRYYEDYIEHILANSELDICYITSAANDEIFASKELRIKPFYIKNLLTATFAKLDSKAIVMTTPDLNKGVVKRAPASAHHIYAFHGISSTHHNYRLGAFDHYDSILCIGQYQIDEIRKTEELYGLARKELVLTGYPLVERLWREHEQFKKTANGHASDQDKPPVILIAPSWWWTTKSSSLMESCIDGIIDALGGTEYEVWLRPHPEYMKRYGKRIEQIEKRLKGTKNISMRTKLSSMQVIHEADVLVTDHSTISVDFALATERPVLFIDTPFHAGNAEYERVGLPPVEIAYRDKLGKRLAVDNIAQIKSVVSQMMATKEDFRRGVPALRDELVANWQKSGRVGGDYILMRAKS